MTLKLGVPLGFRLLAATITGNSEALENAIAEIEAIHGRPGNARQ